MRCALILTLILAYGPAMATETSELCDIAADFAKVTAEYRDKGGLKTYSHTQARKMPVKYRALFFNVVEHTFAYPRLTPDKEREWVKDYCEEMHN